MVCWQRLGTDVDRLIIYTPFWQPVLYMHPHTHTHISILVPPCLLSFTGISQLNEFCMKKTVFPQRVCYGSNSHSVTSALWLIPPTLNKVILFPIYTPRVIKGEKLSLPTVNISKCLTESQFCVTQTIFPDVFIRTLLPIQKLKFMMWYPPTVHELSSETVSTVQFLCFWRMGGGKQLFREEVPVSIKVRTHSQS